jgi:hypothetical protein
VVIALYLLSAVRPALVPVVDAVVVMAHAEDHLVDQEIVSNFVSTFSPYDKNNNRLPVQNQNMCVHEIYPHNNHY